MRKIKVIPHRKEDKRKAEVYELMINYLAKQCEIGKLVCKYAGLKID